MWVMWVRCGSNFLETWPTWKGRKGKACGFLWVMWVMFYFMLLTLNKYVVRAVVQCDVILAAMLSRQKSDPHDPHPPTLTPLGILPFGNSLRLKSHDPHDPQKKNDPHDPHKKPGRSTAMCPWPTWPTPRRLRASGRVSIWLSIS